MRIEVIAAFVLTVLTCQTATAQNSNVKIAVSVTHTGVDSVGKQFAYSVREAVRASNGYRLVDEADSVINVSIVTVDPESSRSQSNLWTAAAIGYTMSNFLPYEKGNPQTWYPIHLSAQVMTIGNRRLPEQARSVMATIEELLQTYRDEARR